MKASGVVLNLSFWIFLTGCVVGPDYRRPGSPMAEAWSVKSPEIEVSTASPWLNSWWAIFKDPILTGLIERVSVGNLDLRQAQARLREARARRDLAEAGLFPTISAKGAVNQSSGNGQGGNNITTELYSNKLDATWEIDVFGKLRRGIEAADATLQASEEDFRDILISLYAEVALNYVDLRSFQARIALTEANVLAQQNTANLTEWRYQAGLTTQLDVEQAQQNLAATRATLPTLRSGFQQAEHRLGVLIGQPPGALKLLLDSTHPIPVAPLKVAIGLPADLLRQRPDVRRTERKLAAQTAQIGVAKAARYPNFTLSGFIGLETLGSANLYSAGAKAFQIAANTAMVLFDAGRLRRNIDIQTALQEQALALYESTLLQAQRDVENALVAFLQEQMRRDNLQTAVNAGQHALQLADNQYESGTIDFLRVLDAQRSLLNVQTQLASSQAEVAADLIRLFKALGGGWDMRASTNPS